MNKNTKKALLSLTVFTALAAPLAGYAFAQTPSSTAKTMTLAQAAQPADAETNDGPDTQDSSVKGSLSLPADTAEAAGTEVPDTQEQSQYQGLAKISAAQASAAAQAKVPGAVTSVTLGDENGSLVYEVVIGNVAVLVDAGNGQVLGQSAADAEGPETGTESGTETGN